MAAFGVLYTVAPLPLLLERSFWVELRGPDAALLEETMVYSFSRPEELLDSGTACLLGPCTGDSTTDFMVSTYG